MSLFGLDYMHFVLLTPDIGDASELNLSFIAFAQSSAGNFIEFLMKLHRTKRLMCDMKYETFKNLQNSFPNI